MTIDESYRKKENGSNEYYYSKALESEDLLYIRAFCLPQEKDEKGHFICNTTDYFKFIIDINNDLNDLLKINASKETTTTGFFIGDPKSDDPPTFFKVIPFILIVIQMILILIVLVIHHVQMISIN